MTVGMPLFCGERYVAEAIASIQGDDFTDWEILALDDCSPDSSAQIVESFGDGRIRLIRNETNQGLVRSRNRILAEARGEYVAWLDQDDLNYPQRLAKQVAYLDAHPETAMVSSWTDTRVEESEGSARVFTQMRPSGHEDIRATMLFQNPVACNTAMMRAGAFAEAGLTFRHEFGNTLDYDMWSRASDIFKLHALPVPLGAYRVHGGQTSQGAELLRMNAQALQVQAELIQRALGIKASEEELQLHCAITQPPLSVTNEAKLLNARAWLTRLRTANEHSRGFSQRGLDLAIARQWQTIVKSAVGPSRARRASALVSGARAIGLPWTAIQGALSEGAKRRATRG